MSSLKHALLVYTLRFCDHLNQMVIDYITNRGSRLGREEGSECDRSSSESVSAGISCGAGRSRIRKPFHVSLWKNEFLKLL